MIPVPAGVRVWLATGHTDTRRGFPSLALLVQKMLKADPHGGHLFVFRGKGGDLVKIIWHDGQGCVPVLEKAGARAVHLADAGGGGGDDLAKMRRDTFGASSERGAKLIDQNAKGCGKRDCAPTARSRENS